MNDFARVEDGLDLTVSFLRRGIEALCYAVVVVGLVCLIGLTIAGTFGILHNGDDFGFDLNSSDPGGGAGGGGDAIVLPSVLS